MTKPLSTKSLVLYADDDSDDHELIRDAFSRYERVIDLVTFHDGQELIDYLKDLGSERTPCLVILDINMPRLDGKQTLKAIRHMGNYENLPVILFSTSTMPHDAEYARRHGASFLTKPIHAGQIDPLIEQMLDHCDQELKNRIKQRRDRY